MAMAIPPRLMVLILYPNNLKTIILIKSDMGIATRDMTVVLKFIRNTSSTIITKTDPSRRAF
jgi:hypothetical protein